MALFDLVSLFIFFFTPLLIPLSQSVSLYLVLRSHLPIFFLFCFAILDDFFLSNEAENNRITFFCCLRVITTNETSETFFKHINHHWSDFKLVSLLLYRSLTLYLMFPSVCIARIMRFICHLISQCSLYMFFFVCFFCCCCFSCHKSRVILSLLFHRRNRFKSIHFQLHCTFEMGFILSSNSSDVDINTLLSLKTIFPNGWCCYALAVMVALLI